MRVLAITSYSCAHQQLRAIVSTSARCACAVWCIQLRQTCSSICRLSWGSGIVVGHALIELEVSASLGFPTCIMSSMITLLQERLCCSTKLQISATSLKVYLGVNFLMEQHKGWFEHVLMVRHQCADDAGAFSQKVSQNFIVTWMFHHI